MKRIGYCLACVTLLSSCHIYQNYKRPEGLPVDSLYRDSIEITSNDSVTLGDISWQDLFQDEQLQLWICFARNRPKHSLCRLVLHFFRHCPYLLKGH